MKIFKKSPVVIKRLEKSLSVTQTFENNQLGLKYSKITRYNSNDDLLQGLLEYIV